MKLQILKEIKKYIIIVDDENNILSSQKLPSIYNEMKDYNRDNKTIEKNYSLEKLYLNAMDYHSDTTIITWPESQNLMNKKWFKNEAILINDDLGLNFFGGSSYIIPKSKLKK